MPSYPITYKQLEALYWVVELNGFHAAASKLHTTQSAISKRIKDLESCLDVSLFDRSKQAARLTTQGQEFWLMAGQLLSQRDAALQAFSAQETMPAHLRVGVSEITAMTWLPHLVRNFRSTYPNTVLQFDVDTAIAIEARLHEGRLDAAIVPQILLDQRWSHCVLGTVDYALVCTPDALRSALAIAPSDLAAYSLLMQCPETSSTARLFLNWARTHHLDIGNAVRCNSLHALVGMALSNLGLAYLPRVCVSSHLRNRSLLEVCVQGAPPPVAMAIAHAPRPARHHIHALVEITRACCDYDVTP